MNKSAHPLIQRILIRAIPLPHNKKYYPHEAAHIVILIREEEQQKGLEKLQQILARERWQLLEVEQHDKLIRTKCVGEGDEFRENYLRAEEHGDSVIVFPDNFAAGKSREYSMLPPRLTEQDFDQIIEQAGGSRYQPMGNSSNLDQNADYLLLDHIVELKEIQDNALEKPTRQQRIAKLFQHIYPGDFSVQLDPALLDDHDQHQFNKIIGEPIQRALKKAVKQIRTTQKQLPNQVNKSAIILVNSGTHFFTHDLFCYLANNAFSPYKEEIDELICISISYLTNGFDYHFNFAINQAPPGSDFQIAFADAYNTGINKFMNRMMQEQILDHKKSLPPHKSLGFDHDGRTYYWEPETLPSSINPPH